MNQDTNDATSDVNQKDSLCKGVKTDGDNQK